VVYTYYVGYDTKRASKYYFDGDTWKPYQKVSNKFLKLEDKWAFDPTVRFTVSSSDMWLIINERENKYIDTQYENVEYYSGADAYHGNFTMAIDDRVEYDPETFDGLSDEEAKEIMWKRLLKLPDEPKKTRGAFQLMLQKKFPDAVPQKNDVDVMYEISFEVYFGAGKSDNYTVTYQCTASGNPPEFTYVEGNTPYSE
jgi:hypothetical protein